MCEIYYNGVLCTVDALLVTAATILFGHFLRSILLSKLKMVTNSAATIQERLLITHLRYMKAKCSLRYFQNNFDLLPLLITTISLKKG